MRWFDLLATIGLVIWLSYLYNVELLFPHLFFTEDIEEIAYLLFISSSINYILIALAFPMYAILSKSFENKDGFFIGFENYQSYFANPALVYSIYNSLFISIITMFITIYRETH